MRADTFKNFLIKMNSFPLWVKQVIFLYLKSNLVKNMTRQALNCSPENLLQVYKPEITYLGKKELSERNNCHEEVMYTFLKSVSEGKNIIDITLDCFFTLEEISKLYVEAREHEYLKVPNINEVDATAHFLAGKIKTGEYLMRLGRITIDQLDSAIRYQERLGNEGKKMLMAEVLSTMHFIQKDEILAVLLMKEEAKKRFIFNIDLNSGEISDFDTIELQKQVQKLQYENNYLKTKINAILKME